MRFNCKRKVNTSKFYKRIFGKKFDKDLYGFETEDIEVMDCDSFDEAAKEADKLVAEREMFYMGKVQAEYDALSPSKPEAKSTAATSTNEEEVVKVEPITEEKPPVTGSVQPGVTNTPPADFQ